MQGRTCCSTISRITSSPAMLKPSRNAMCGLMRAAVASSPVTAKVVMLRSMVPPPMSTLAMRRRRVRAAFAAHEREEVAGVALKLFGDLVVR